MKEGEKKRRKMAFLRVVSAHVVGDAVAAKLEKQSEKKKSGMPHRK